MTIRYAGKRFTGSGGRWPGLFIGLFMLFIAGPVFAQDPGDLLEMPAEKSERAANSILMDIQCVNGKIFTVGERGFILRSDSACNDWDQADVPVSVTLTAVHFPTTEKGWAVGHDGVILHSEDGGRTWVKQLDGRKINDLIFAQLKQMIREKTAMLEDENSGLDEDAKETLKIEIEDLGFFLSDVELAVEEGPTRPLMDVWFKNEREGLVIGSFGMIFRTDDGGKHWKPLLDQIYNPYGYHFYGITRCGSDLFMAGEGGMLFRSEDFGRTWKALESPYEGSFFGIVADPGGGFVAAYGLRGHMYMSRDRGETWSALDTGMTASISGGLLLSDGSLCIAGVDGYVMRSIDGGKTFSRLPVRFPGSISLAEPEENVLMVVGLRGYTRIDLNDPIRREKG
ncbi:MAG: YCF48-related protein [Desulfobacterales bacterium]